MAVSLVSRMLAGDRRALSRILSQLENGSARADSIDREIFPHTGQAHIVGITGAPGTGKSSLVSSLASAIRNIGEEVAILAVDPSSSISGGAIMGDRIRMGQLSGDSGVFIRSMATRGNLGGLSRATRISLRALDAAGFPIILVETVGAGQNEVEIAQLAHTIVVVEAPGLGDDIQAIKAGLLEIADILVVNKADRPGARQTARDLQRALELGPPPGSPQGINHHGQAMGMGTRDEASESPKENWSQPILETVATRSEGIGELLTHIQKHKAYISSHQLLSIWWRRQLTGELREEISAKFQKILWGQVSTSIFESALAQLISRKIAPSSAVESILDSCKILVNEDAQTAQKV